MRQILCARSSAPDLCDKLLLEPIVKLLLTGCLVPFFLVAQGQPPRLLSPEVHPDKTVTFRLRSPNAVKVLLSREGAKAAEMVKDEKGVWSFTSPVLEPDMYGYSFNVDGTGMIDPVNPRMKLNLLNTNSLVHVPSANASLAWETRAVPRGHVHHHFFRSAICDDERDFFVYTPPGYDARSEKVYPVLYLLHGFSDGANGWSEVGQAHVILDNLIAQGTARPMLVVMPLGYGTMEILQSLTRNADLAKKSYTLFSESLRKEVLPQVESTYRASKDRTQRALAGLSMGGAETLFVGLNHLELFAWLGAFSSGGMPTDFEATWPSLDETVNEKLKLFWMSCGKDDFLFDTNNKFVAALQAKGVKPEYLVTEGAHTWLVWRRNLAAFASKLFR